jgi:glycosyltransferase involved in cell wall biosynthesis
MSRFIQGLTDELLYFQRAGLNMESPATVMHLIPQLRFGAGRCVVDMAVEQALGLKHRVVVCASTDADDHWRSDPVLISELVSNGVQFETIGDFFHRRADMLHRCAVRIRELHSCSNNTTVIHAHTAMAAAAGYWAQPAALIATCHGWGPNRPADYDLEDSLALQLCDAVLTYSTHWLERMQLDLAVSEPKKIWMGVNLDRFPKPMERHVLDSSCPRIVTVCELTHRKGVDILLKAMSLIWEQMPNTELHIMGHGDDAERLRSIASEIDTGFDRIRFYGSVNNPYSRLADFDIFVLPSRSDNLPIAILEAMLAGLPIVAAGVGGVPELLDASESGGVVPAESATGLAKGIIQMLRQGRDCLTSMGKRGQAFVREQLDVRKTAIELETIYCGALRKRARQNPVA